MTTISGIKRDLRKKKRKRKIVAYFITEARFICRQAKQRLGGNLIYVSHQLDSCSLGSTFILGAKAGGHAQETRGENNCRGRRERKIFQNKDEKRNGRANKLHLKRNALPFVTPLLPANSGRRVQTQHNTTIIFSDALSGSCAN